MSGQASKIAFSEREDRRVVLVGGRPAATLAEALASAPELKAPGGLGKYCDVVNYLARGRKYRVIHDPDAYRARYDRRFLSEDPDAPFQEGVPRLRDFGLCQTAEIQAPRAEGGSVIFYVEDDFLGIPYRVAAPAPDRPEGDITYDPVPMSPMAE
jgi:hypothetical protein